MTPTEAQVEAGARAICIAAGDDPDKITYAHEMKCSGHEREPKERWQYWTEFSRVWRNDAAIYQMLRYAKR